MLIEVHADLHSEVGPPPKPNPFQMEYITNKLRAETSTDRLEVINHLIDHFDDLSLTEHINNDERKAMRIAENLLEQYDFIVEGIHHG